MQYVLMLNEHLCKIKRTLLVVYMHEYWFNSNSEVAAVAVAYGVPKFIFIGVLSNVF